MTDNIYYFHFAKSLIDLSVVTWILINNNNVFLFMRIHCFHWMSSSCVNTFIPVLRNDNLFFMGNISQIFLWKRLREMCSCHLLDLSSQDKCSCIYNVYTVYLKKICSTLSLTCICYLNRDFNTVCINKGSQQAQRLIISWV